MDSMRRSEANISHHHNKVVINSQATDSNKQLNISGSNLNNNNVSNKQQHQSASSNQNQQTSDIKESNFEYDDNEWDVGIGDLIIDLDADIEKSSLVNTAISSIASNSSSSSSATFSTTGSAGINTTGNKKPLYQDQQSSSSSGKHSSSNIPKISVAKHKIGDERKSGNNISKHSVLISQLNSQLTITSKNPSISSSSASSSLSSSPDLSKSRESLVPSLSSADIEIKAKNLNAMSSTTNSSGGKSATKLAVDHQATLDKGLKMKIKRTKPGTKTSEAKHEIVKAEQNGTSSSNTDDSGCNNTTTNSSSSSSNKKHTSQSLQQQPITASPLVSVSANAQQGTKRGSSGHRKDKTKEKTPHHTQRDKIEHNSTIQNADRGCICTHDMQVNGVQQPCSNISCIRNRTTEQTSPLSQRLQSSNQNNSSTGSALTSSNTANAPGPPNSTSKDSKKSNVPVPILIHSSSQISSSLNSAQLSSIQSNSTNNSSSSNNSNNNSSNSSSNNVLKSQLQGSSVPTSLLSVLSSAAANASSSSSTNTSSSSSSSSSNSSSSNLSMSDDKTNPPPAKRHKCDPKDMVDVCVGTSVGTITEPDCLGPCEPGTSVTLEGIVWHETEGGVLVVNVTWRGKTYVGTLIDCTKHDWAPPRFCDSPTEELDSRTPKGRGKRGRSAALTPNNDLSNFTETRSSVHSKLRNGGAKGRTGRTTTTTETPSKTTNTATTTTAGNNTNTPSTSPIAFLPPRSEKRKSKDESPPPVNGSSTSSSSSSNGGNNQANASGIINNGASGTQSLLNPVTGLNVQISTKKIKSTASPCAISPVLLECPEQDCGKKYKHANGLKYHQSHAHPSSMDEDSSQAPESPTTPSPTPTSQPANPPLTPTSGTQTGTTPSQPTTPTPSLAPVGPTNPVLPGTLNNQPILTTTTTPASSQPCITSSSSTVNTSSGIGLLTTATTTTTTHQLPPHPQGPAPSGGSITTGVAGQPQNLISSSTASVILGTAPSTNNQEPLSPMAQQQNINNGITTTPVRTDGSVKVKSSVLRFGPVSNDGDMGRMPPQNVTGPPPSLTLGGQGPMRNPSMPGTPESVPNFAGLANAQAPQGLKSQNFTKQKKNRKSPGPDFDNSSSSRAEDVQSPAYSDISDDSTPVIEASDVDKSKASQLSEGGKKPADGSLGGYMYPFYPHQSPYFPPDPGAPKGMPQPPIGSNNLEYNKNKEPPLDLMNKPAPQTVPDGSGPMSKENSGPSPLPAPNKLMSHYYPPYNYMSGYPYNLDPNYGVPMMSEDNKMAQQAQIKEEQRMKESPSPNDYGKMGPQQMVPTKLIKSEPISAKDIKTEPGHPMHSNKEQQPQPGPQSLGPSLYPGMYRHGSSQPQQPPPQHLSREEELRRYFTYPEQRRSSTSSNSSSTNMTSKDEPQSPSQGQQQQSVNNPQSNQPQQHQQKAQKPSSVTKLKDSMKSEDKEVVKVKQEGQKPTMETQGPPPPPTSQYYLHPPYMNPTPFGFDPNPMYRNMLVPTPSYNASPYHLQMARYPSPEDLSRNPNTKALDLLQHHASQYYNSHKIHELSERALKSPTSNVKVSVSSPNMPPQNSGQNPNIGMPPSNPGGPGLPGSGPQQPSQPPQMQQSSGPGGPNNPDRNENSSSSGPKDGPPQGPGGGPQSQGQSGRSPPPQRHVHTHHHTHVGLGYPMFQPPYGAAVLASQQAAAVTVISPFPTGPPAK